MSDFTIKIKHTSYEYKTLTVMAGSNLRRVLLQAGISPYTQVTKNLNCGGRGLCATCGVYIHTPVKAKHWHDKLARQFRYPRLSCQITVEEDLEIEIPNKIIWGDRQPK